MPRNYQRREYHFRGRHRHYLAIPFEGRYIWGATAGMLYSLCRAFAGECGDSGLRPAGMTGRAVV